MGSKALDYVSDRFIFPFSMTVEEECDQRAEQPGNEQGDENTFLSSVRQFGGSCQERNAIGDRNPDEDCCDDGDPHRCNRIARTAHDTGKALRYGHCDIADRKDAHHVTAQFYELRCFGKDAHERFAENQNQACNDGGCSHRN